MRWRLHHPRDWSPVWFEHILYRPPDGGQRRNGRILALDSSPGHHLIRTGGYTFTADARDIFPAPGWREDREAWEREKVEAGEDN